MKQTPSIAALATLFLLACTDLFAPTPTGTQESVAVASTSVTALVAASASVASASANASANASAYGSASAVASAALPEPIPIDPAAAKQWTGTYESTRATVETPPKVPDLTWKKDDGSVALGPGEITIDVADGAISGSATGALGAQKLVGVLDGSVFRLELLPVDPTLPLSMAGCGVGEIADGVLSGVLRVSGSKAVEVREVSFSLKPSR